MTSKRPEALGGRDFDAHDPRAARAAALDALARRDYSTGELHRKLVEKGFEPTLAGEILDALRAEKLLDDRRYVEGFIGYRAARGQGPLRIRAELRRLGVTDELVEQGIQAYGDWLVQLRKARQKKFGAAPPTDYAEGQRQARFLGYRGFSGAQIRLVLGFDTDIDADV